MSMTNREIVRQVRAFRRVRADWVDQLSRPATADSVQAAQHVLSVNSKIELLLTMWNWGADDGVEFPHGIADEKPDCTCGFPGNPNMSGHDPACPVAVAREKKS